MVVSDHPPLILVVFGVLDISWWPFVFGVFLLDPVLIGFWLVLVVFRSCRCSSKVMVAFSWSFGSFQWF